MIRICQIALICTLIVLIPLSLKAQSLCPGNPDVSDDTAFATAKARATEAGGHPDGRIAERKRLRRQLGARAFDDRRQIRFVGMRDDVKEFLAADPPRDIRGTGIAFQDLAKRCEHEVARVMAMRIVHVLEMIEVDHHHPEREAVTDRGGQLVRGPGLDRAPPTSGITQSVMTMAGRSRSNASRPLRARCTRWNLGDSACSRSLR
jgi:hypothetical protein